MTSRRKRLRRPKPPASPTQDISMKIRRARTFHWRLQQRRRVKTAVAKKSRVAAPIWAQRPTPEGFAVSREGSAKGKGGQPGAPKGAGKGPPPLVGSVVQAPNSKDGGVGGRGKLS